MHVQRYGTGRHTYVGLHGWGGSAATFEPLEPYVPPTASLYALDLPGYGQSPRPRAWTAAAVAEECASAIDGLGRSPVALIGNCSGAILALLAAARLQRPVSRLVLIDPFAFVPWYFAAFVQPGWGTFAYHSTFANPVGRWLTNAALRHRRSTGAHLTRSFVKVDHTVSLRYLELLNAVGDIEQFRKAGPVDIIYGERTFAAVKTSLLRWQALWPHARVQMIPNAGHLPIAERPAVLSSAIFDSVNVAPRRASVVEECR